jgi:hypothetical protein
MSQLTARIAMGTMAALLIFMAATTNSAFAQGAPNPKAIQQQKLNQQLFTTGTAKIGNVTLRLGGGVLVTLRLGGGVMAQLLKSTSKQVKYSIPVFSCISFCINQLPRLSIARRRSRQHIPT